jgi:hypothetical protein
LRFAALASVGQPSAVEATIAVAAIAENRNGRMSFAFNRAAQSFPPLAAHNLYCAYELLIVIARLRRVRLAVAAGRSVVA